MLFDCNSMPTQPMIYTCGRNRSQLDVRTLRTSLLKTRVDQAGIGTLYDIAELDTKHTESEKLFVCHQLSPHKVNEYT